MIFYNENVNESGSVVLGAVGCPRMLNVEKGRWYSLVCLEGASCCTKVSANHTSYSLQVRFMYVQSV